MKWLAVVVVVASIMGCRGTKIAPLDLANQQIDAAVASGIEASSDTGPTTLTARYNPAPCECPPYEVFAFGRWMRAFIDGEAPALTALQSADALDVATFSGVVETERRPAENGVSYPVVSIQ